MIPVVLVTLAALGLACFWERVCAWFADHLRPWIARSLPDLLPYVETAFRALDAVMSPLRAGVLAAWRVLRPHLLSAVLYIERRSNDRFVLRITSILRRHLTTTERASVRTEETEVDWSELPEAIRSRFLAGEHRVTMDLVAERDRELCALEVA